MSTVRDLFMLQTHRGAYRVCRPEEIIVIHVNDHVCTVTLVGEAASIVLVKSSLQDLLDVLPDGMFCRIGKNTAVNINHVLRFEGDKLFLTDDRVETISLRSSYLKSFLDRFVLFPDSNS